MGTIERVDPKTNDDVVFLRNNAQRVGTPGANATSKRLSMSSEMLGDNVSRYKLDRNWEG
jgi:hypothetical protein